MFAIKKSNSCLKPWNHDDKQFFQASLVNAYIDGWLFETKEEAEKEFQKFVEVCKKGKTWSIVDLSKPSSFVNYITRLEAGVEGYVLFNKSTELISTDGNFEVVKPSLFNMTPYATELEVVNAYNEYSKRGKKKHYIGKIIDGKFVFANITPIVFSHVNPDDIENFSEIKGFVVFKGEHILIKASNGKFSSVHYKRCISAEPTYKDAYNLLLEAQENKYKNYEVGIFMNGCIIKLDKKISDNSDIFEKLTDKVVNNILEDTNTTLLSEIISTGVDSKKVKVENVCKISHDIDEELDKVDTLLKGITKKYAEYRKELDEVEQYLVDFYHFVEFSELDGVSGYKAYYIHKKLLEHRRHIKDNMAKIEQMTKIQDEISKCRAAFISMENRTYTPRISNDLFINNYRGMEVKGKAGGNVIDELYKKFKAT